MTDRINESARDIQVLDRVQVVVAGAGVAGCSAAVSAAKAGAKTVLIERNGCLGGVATASYMSNIGNLLVTADSRKAHGGFAAELIERLVDQDGASALWRNAEVPGCVIDSERMKLVLIQMLEDAGVQVLTHAMAVLPVMEGSDVKGVIIESKSGRQAVLSDSAVDATGEADIACRAGAETVFSKGNASTLFQLGNVDLDRFVDFVLEDPEGFPSGMDLVKDAETFARNWRERGILFFPHWGGRNWRWLQDDGGLKDKIGIAYNLQALGMYGLKGKRTVAINSNYYTIENLDIENLSEKELHAQKMCYYVAEFMTRRLPGFEKSHIVSMASDLGVRYSRRITGVETFSGELLHDLETPYIHDRTIGSQPTWDTRKAGKDARGMVTCDIPFDILVPRGAERILIGSGKSVSTEPIGALRSMAGCMICGQAAGTASALAALNGSAPSRVPIRQLQQALKEQNVYFGEKDRLNKLGLA